jgi:hypothetical protein
MVKNKIIVVKKSSAAVGIIACVILASAGCASLPRNHSTTVHFDTSYSAPADWKLVEEWKWGLRFNVPPALRDMGVGGKSLWIHEDTNLKVIVDFSYPRSYESLKTRKNYSDTRLNVNGLPALVCSYDQSENAVAGSLNKVVALFFLETRKGLGSPYEPSYRVEFSAEGDRITALQILQTVRFFDP